MGIPDCVQEAVLLVSDVGSIGSLEETMRQALRLVLPNVSDLVVYIRQPTSTAAAAAAAAGSSTAPAVEVDTAVAPMPVADGRGLEAAGIIDTSPYRPTQQQQLSEERQQLLQQHKQLDQQQQLGRVERERSSVGGDWSRRGGDWELISSQAMLHTMPEEGFIWSTARRGERACVEGLDASDPLSGLLMSGTEPLKSRRKVVCSPVYDYQRNSLVCLYAAVCERLTPDDHQHLSFLEKQFVISYRRLKQQYQQQQQNSNSSVTSAVRSQLLAAARTSYSPAISAATSISCTCPSCGAVISCTCPTQPLTNNNNTTHNNLTSLNTSHNTILDNSQIHVSVSMPINTHASQLSTSGTLPPQLSTSVSLPPVCPLHPHGQTHLVNPSDSCPLVVHNQLESAICPPSFNITDNSMAISIQEPDDNGEGCDIMGGSESYHGDNNGGGGSDAYLGGGDADSDMLGFRLGVSDSRRVSTTSFMTSRDESVLSLCANLYDQDATSLQLKVLRYLIRRTNSESCFLLLIDTELQELFCQVIGSTVLQEEIRFPINRRGFSAVISTKKSINLDQIDKEDFGSLRDYLPREINSFMCIPVVCRVTNDVMAIACLVNRIGCESFTEEDERTVEHCFTYTAAVLHSTISVQNERRLKTQTQVLLQVATNLFSHLEDLTILLGEVMQEARSLTKAERCSVFLLDKEHNELIAKVFDGDASQERDASGELRLPADQGIAGHVATTGELLNIEDTYSHPLFYRGIDEATGFRTRNILCFPIKDEQGEVIGVAQLCNKINGVRFSKYDENIAKAFSVFCCVSIVHSLMYKKVRDIQHRSKLSNELMIYHMKVTAEEVHSLADIQIPDVEVINSDMMNFSFIPRVIPVDTTPLAVLSMMDDLGFLGRHRIRSTSIAQFLLMVRKGYRDPPYHNWQHAFSVVHFCYLLYRNTSVMQCLEDIEALALFIACLCHDIDHRGTTNSFQVASGSVLAALYSSEGSVLERHHFAQTMCILNTDGCNIFENLSRENYMRVLDLMRDIILATDLAQHLRKIKDIEKMADEGYNKKRRDHRSLLLGLLMTACDLSDQTKNFHNSTSIAERIYTEFFSQGDLERRIGRDPMEMMDREKAVIPDLQVVFLDTIALPVYRLLKKLVPESSEVVEAVENNRKMWIQTNTRLLDLELPRDMNMFHHLDSLLEIS